MVNLVGVGVKKGHDWICIVQIIMNDGRWGWCVVVEGFVGFDISHGSGLCLIYA